MLPPNLLLMLTIFFSSAFLRLISSIKSISKVYYSMVSGSKLIRFCF